MKRKRRKWSQLNSDELREATRVFDDPSYNPPAVRPSRSQLAALRRTQRKAARTRIAVSLDGRLVDQADAFALRHGLTLSELVADALRRAMKRRSA